MNIILLCPHCSITILVEELNCRIFRCGMYKHNNTQINPHMCKIDCETLYMSGQIYGCGKPFKLIDDMSGGFISTICEYI
jgi:hypothetical protein